MTKILPTKDTRTLVVLVSAALAAGASADSPLFDGDSSMFLCTGAIGPFANLHIGQTDFDALSQNHWYYRIEGDPTQTRLDIPVEVIQVDQNEVIRTFTDARGVEFAQRVTLTDQEDQNVSITHTLQVTNTSDKAITINVFNYADIEIDGSEGDTASVFPAALGPLFRVTDESAEPGFKFELQGAGANRFEVDEPSALLSEIEGGGEFNAQSMFEQDNFGPGNFAAVLQWTVPLQSGVSTTLHTAMSSQGEVCLGDCDDSGDVDFNDLTSMLFAFGEDTPACDADDSGAVDFNDLTTALFLFGPCE